MDEILEWVRLNFDWYFVVMILLGNYFIFSLVTYPEIITRPKKSKVYLTAFHSVIIGAIYYYIDKTVHIKILINSFLLSTSIYELGLKDLLEYVKNNGSNMIIKKVLKDSAMEDSKEEPKQG